VFLELVDILRCPRPHEETWLVASATRMEDRHIVEGELGCHVCDEHYPIRNGVAQFGERATARLVPPPPVLARESAAMRLAALLGLAEPGGVVLLTGSFGNLAHPMAMMIGDTQLLVVNPVEAIGFGDTVSALTTASSLPLANSSCRGAAVDPSHADPEFAAEVARVLKSGARFVAPVTLPVPAGVTELARDDHEWVGEQRDAIGTLVPLSVSRPK
jgi:uncharacterized protein YbaR (Trm112 family)